MLHCETCGLEVEGGALVACDYVCPMCGGDAWFDHGESDQDALEDETLEDDELPYIWDKDPN